MIFTSVRSPSVVVEAHLVADDVTELAAELLRDAVGHGARRDPARLRVADQAAHTPTELEADLGQLRRLARPGFARDHDDLVVSYRCPHVVDPRRDRQLRRVRDLRHGRPARLDARPGSRYRRGDGCVLTFALGLLEAPPQPMLVAQHEVR